MARDTYTVRARPTAPPSTGIRTRDSPEWRGFWALMTIVTSNRALTEWPTMFGDPLLASAALDRLLHNAHVLEIDGDSYRTTRRK